VAADEGFSDAACRSLVGAKYTTGRPLLGGTVPPPLDPALYPLALQNLRTCVVGLQSRWNATLQVLDFWFPWIDYTSQPFLKRMAIFKTGVGGMETRHTLLPELAQIILDLNPCDAMLYAEAERLFERQMRVLGERHF